MDVFDGVNVDVDVCYQRGIEDLPVTSLETREIDAKVNVQDAIDYM